MYHSFNFCLFSLYSGQGGQPGACYLPNDEQNHQWMNKLNSNRHKWKSTKNEVSALWKKILSCFSLVSTFFIWNEHAKNIYYFRIFVYILSISFPFLVRIYKNKVNILITNALNYMYEHFLSMNYIHS